MLSGIYSSTEGEIIFWDKRDKIHLIGKTSPAALNHIGIARTFQNLRLFSRSTILDNVMTAAQSHTKYTFIESVTHFGRWNSKEKKNRATSMELLERVGLAKRANQVSGTLPYGMQRRLEIARALALKPTLLMLDEPAAGMNEEEVIVLNELIQGIHRDFSLTILVIEHHMDMIMEICPHIMCMNFGAKIAEGSPDTIQKDPEVLKAYLGDDDDEEVA
jgi:branched-chain amino acid transport system ATP-binding protein